MLLESRHVYGAFAAALACSCTPWELAQLGLQGIHCTGQPSWNNEIELKWNKPRFFGCSYAPLQMDRTDFWHLLSLF